MSNQYLHIAGGTVHDPTNYVDGQTLDVWVLDGKIVAAPRDPNVLKTTIDAHGLIVMAGGVDMHCHIAGTKVNAARLMTAVEHSEAAPLPRSNSLRSGTMGSVPSTFATGYRYLGLGYTSAFDAAVPPLGARNAHQELNDTPGIDKGFYVLAGNNEYALDAIAKNEADRLDAFLGWLVETTKSYSVKLVNPGGVAAWRLAPFGNVTGLDDAGPLGGLTPRTILREMAASAERILLPHAVHVHCNNLGVPGNWQTTLDTMQALEAHRAHLTHIQFHSYGGGANDEISIRSQVEPLAEYVNTHDHLTVDVGQVLFDKTMTMTADSPAAHYLAKLHGAKMHSADVEVEAGCGVSPIHYRRKSLVHAWQWAIGLEWYLLVQDPWRIAMSTDHPNGGSFLAYPQIIRLLMDRGYRQEMLKSVHRVVRDESLLRNLDREYSLNEIATITRAARLGCWAFPTKDIWGREPTPTLRFILPTRTRKRCLPSHATSSNPEWSWWKTVNRASIRWARQSTPMCITINSASNRSHAGSIHVIRFALAITELNRTN